MKLAIAALVVSSTLLAVPGPALAQTPVGLEFQVNTYTPGYQWLSATALDDDGDFVIVWSSTQDGDSDGIFAQRFGPKGAPQGDEFQVNLFTPNNQQAPAVTFQADGGFVVVWGSYGQDGTSSGFGIFARRYDSTGSAVTDEVQVNTYTTSTQAGPDVASAANGDFVVVWSSGQQDGNGYGIFGQRFDSAGDPQAAEFMVNSFTSNHQYGPEVSLSPAGDFVVAWRSYEQDGSASANGVFAQRFDSAGTPVGGEFQVNTYTEDNQVYPAVAVDDEGDFVIAWAASGRNGNYYDVLAQRYDSLGIAIGVEFMVNEFTDTDQEYPSIGNDAEGGFVIAWVGGDRYGTEENVWVRRFDSAGVAQGVEHEVNTHDAGSQFLPAAAVNDGGAFVVSWTSEYQDGSEGGVFAQRFAGLESLAPLDVDGDGSTLALIDGVLLLRYLFELLGTIAPGDVGAQCTRCDAGALATYLGSIEDVIDVDGDGETEPLTDGVLVLRFLSNFTGTALTAGAVDTEVGECTRCDAADIVEYLEPLV